jgi:NAD(P)-dependent dehydrogenase (short-subunit alcohol dehydrogenase family)
MRMVNLKSSNLFSVKNKTIVITGASGFLGRSMAQTLLQNGGKVIGLGRSQRLMKEVQKWKEKFGDHKVEGYRVDMYDLAKLEIILNKIVKREKGEIHGLINNAHELGANTGFNVAEGCLENADHEQWLKNTMGGVFWPALTTKIIGAAMKENNYGSIINICSMYGVVAPSPKLYENTAFKNPPGYSVAKAAIHGLTRYTASFWGANGIRANSISPGPFSNVEEKTENSVLQNDEFLNELRNRTCLLRLGKATELCGSIIFLISDASSYVTGHNLIVDGGWTIV